MLEKPCLYSLRGVFFLLTMCQDMSEKQVPETMRCLKTGLFPVRVQRGQRWVLIKEGKHHKVSCQSCRAGVGKTLRGVQLRAESLC